MQINTLYAHSRPSTWSALDPTANYPPSIDPSYLAEAHALLVEIDIWKSSFAVSKPLEEMTRLDLGNLIYLDTMDVSYDRLSLPRVYNPRRLLILSSS